MRKVIQLSVVSPSYENRKEIYHVMYALCDDGTIWWKNETSSPEEGRWHLDEDVPQYKIKKDNTYV